jgi:predicted glycosyltransferase
MAVLMLRGFRLEKTPSPGASTATGVASGVLNGAFGIGGPPVVVETFRDDFPDRLRGAALSVSQAGYNTVLDVVRAGVRAVVVPYEGSGDEQPLRARLLAERGVLIVVPAGELSPARLAAAIESGLSRSDFPAPVKLDLDGARRSAELLGALVASVAAARAGQPSGRR